MKNKEEYIYSCYVTKVYDGDTITVDIDLGLNVTMKDQTLRLYGIDTPELRGSEKEEGLKVRDWLRELIIEKKVIIRTHKDSKGKYGRWLAEVFYNGENLNEKMLSLGYAKEYLK